MVKKIKIVCFLWLFSSSFCFAQIQKINGVALTAEQQKALKMAMENKSISEEDLESDNYSDGESISPFKPRARDLQRLASIPQVAPKKEALMAYLSKLSNSIEQNVEIETKNKIQAFVQDKSGVEINQISVLTWLQKEEEQALLLSLKAAQKIPDSTMALNNLSAMLNMAGMEEFAVPILKYNKTKDEKNPVTLNNLGQAYLGMGALPEAETFLKECLSIDVNNPEATRSMGVVELSKGNKLEASKYFEKDLKEHLRESSFEWLKKAKVRQQVRLSDIKRDFLKNKQSKTKDFYGLIAFDDLKMPIIPLTADKSVKWIEDVEHYTMSLVDEYQFWYNKSVDESEEEKLITINKPEAYYSWLVTDLVKELDNIYGADLLPNNDLFIESMVNRGLDFSEKLNAISCQAAPPGSDIETIRAYDKKCCALKSPIINTFMASHNEDVRKNFEFRNGQWKLYLNELINTVELYPTPDNKKLVYNRISQYILFLQSSVGMIVAESMPEGCEDMTLEEAERIMAASKRKVELNCPAWLHYELAFPTVGSITMNCSEYQVEITPIGIVKAGFKKTFKDQTTTLYVGVGPKLSAGHISLSAGVQGYLVFDRYDQLVNTGISAETKFELPHGIAELSAQAKVEMNSGYSHEVKSDSRWIQQIKSTYSKY